jgi:hypothetical protein
MTEVFQMPVQSMFHMPGQGTIDVFLPKSQALRELGLRFPFPLRGVVTKLPFLFGISI